MCLPVNTTFTTPEDTNQLCCLCLLIQHLFMKTLWKTFSKSLFLPGSWLQVSSPGVQGWCSSGWEVPVWPHAGWQCPLPRDHCALSDGLSHGCCQASGSQGGHSTWHRAFVAGTLAGTSSGTQWLRNVTRPSTEKAALLCGTSFPDTGTRSSFTGFSFGSSGLSTSWRRW